MERTGLLFLFTCQPTKSSNFSRPGVNVRAHLLRRTIVGTLVRFEMRLLRSNGKVKLAHALLDRKTVRTQECISLTTRSSVHAV